MFRTEIVIGRKTTSIAHGRTNKNNAPCLIFNELKYPVTDGVKKEDLNGNSLLLIVENKASFSTLMEEFLRVGDLLNEDDENKEKAN